MIKKLGVFPARLKGCNEQIVLTTTLSVTASFTLKND